MAKNQGLQRPSDAESSPNPKIRVAIIGSGLAGLATAYLLHQDNRSRFDITLFEQVRFPFGSHVAPTISHLKPHLNRAKRWHSMPHL